jgi:tRNA(fMet)-specific endonuclease VapC
VLCELESGIQQMPDPVAGRRRLRSALKHVRIWPLEPTIAEHYGTIWLEMERAGRSLSQVDILLAALARQWRLILLTSDRDFDALPDIQKENWM